jgi:hypothetical protein
MSAKRAKKFYLERRMLKNGAMRCFSSFAAFAFFARVISF